MNRAWSSQSQRTAANVNKNNNTATTQREELYIKLREYEVRRRLAYASKIDSISLYWKSYCDLLSASILETSRCHRTVLGTSHAYLLYAEAMKAIFEDNFLDEKGNIITNKKQKEKVTAMRKKSTNNQESDPSSKSSKSSAAKDAVSVVKEIREAQSVLSSRFQESSTNMEEEIAAAIGALLDTVRDSFTTMERLGSSILVELEKTEQEVAQAWGTYLNSRSNPNDANRSGGSPTEDTSPKNVVDPWVVEMQYRVAVAYQNLAWEKGNDELTKLFAKVKEEEITRRMNLREFLVAFAQRQQRLFLSLPGIQNEVLEDLVGKEMSREELDKTIHKIIEERAAKYKKKNDMGSTLENDDFADFNLESPLASDLLSKAKVVLRIGSGLDRTVCLAVMTADSYLHLFDIDSPKVQLSTSPKIAFTLLTPTLITPNVNNQMLGKTNFGKGWSDPLTPTESLILGKCKVRRVDDVSFELTESITQTGASKFMGKSTRRRFRLMSPTKEDTDDWIQILSA